MILIGQFDSSFVRRVGIALSLLDIAFEHRPWSVFSDAERVRAFNPTLRVPVLLLGTEENPGDVLIETFAILDHLDSLVAAERRLTPQQEPQRRQALKISAMASQVADTAVGLFYEKVAHEAPSTMLVDRRTRQLLDGIAALERTRAQATGTNLLGDRLSNADIAVAASLRHAADAHPGLVSIAAYPALGDHCQRLEAMPVFQRISQAFVAPA
jgi:glutathione S-transferase